MTRKVNSRRRVSRPEQPVLSGNYVVVGNTGLCFDRHRLIREIGRGANGTVFEAQDTELDRSVAIKVWGMPVANPASRALLETRKLVSLAHPLLATVYQFGVSNGYAFAVMEFVAGSSLRDWLAAGERSPRERCAAWWLISKALRFIYDTGAVHGDPHPGNILVYQDVIGYCRPYLGDYLWSKQIGVKLADTGTSRVWRSAMRFRERERRLLRKTVASLFEAPTLNRMVAEFPDQSHNGILTVVNYFAYWYGSYSELSPDVIAGLQKAAQRATQHSATSERAR